MIPAAWIITLIVIVSFNYNFSPFSKLNALIPRRAYRGKYFDYFVLGWGGRILTTFILCSLFHFACADLTQPSDGKAFLLILIIVVANLIWTQYERVRDERRYRIRSAWMDAGQLF